jgi:actin beta/gamma 1
MNRKKSEPESQEETKTTNEPSEKKPVVIIHGAAGTKVGFAGEKYPRFVYPKPLLDMDKRIKRFPIEGDKPTDNGLISLSWKAIHHLLRVDFSEHPVLLSLPTAMLTDCPFRDLVSSFFYEELEAKKIAMISDPFLALVSFLPRIGRLSAILVDIGFSQIRIVPFYNSAILEDHVTQISFGGYYLTTQLGRWLKRQGYEGPVDACFLRDIKENYCFVRPHGKKMTEKNDEIINYRFKGVNYKLDSEKWKLPELFFYSDFFSKKVLFSPRSESEGKKYDMQAINLSQAIGNVIKSLNQNLWKGMFANICLTGGGAQFTGLKERLLAELQASYPKFAKNIRIFTSSHTDLDSFIGGSTLANLSSFQKYWLEKEEYDQGKFELFL